MADDWLCTVHIDGCRGCATACGCDNDATCTGVALNPWQPYHYQQHALSNCDTVKPLKQNGRWMRAADLRPQCDLYRPDPYDTPADDPAAWWWTPNNSQSGGFGFIIHDIEIQTPRERERVTSKLDAVGCTLTGRRYGRIVVEAVGCDVAQSRYLKETLIRWLVDGETKSCDPCQGRTMTLWRDCCVSDEGRTGRRTLTDVRGWIDTEPDDTVGPVTDCGCVFQLEFSAADEVREPDGKLEGVGGWLDGPQCDPICVPETELVEVERLVPKTVKTGDIKLRSDGSRIWCPVDYDPADLPADPSQDCYFAVRNVVALEPAPCCPPELEARVDPDGNITYDPRQPDVWADYLAEVATSGVDCLCPPRIMSFNIPNADFDPLGCDECPPEVRASACADELGLAVDADGFIDFGVAILTDYDVNDPAVQDLLAYARCVGLIPDPEQWCAEQLGTLGGQVTVNLLSGGQIGLECTDGTATYRLFSDPVFGYQDLTGGIVDKSNPVPDPESLEGCASDLPLACLPRITVVPTGQGGPCTTLTLDPATGGITSSVNLATNDATNMRFEWDPCSNLTSPDCDTPIPATPPIVIDTGAETWAEQGWQAGFGWPGSIPGDAYTIAETEWGPNSPDPAVVVETVERPVACGECAIGCDRCACLCDTCAGPCAPSRPTLPAAKPATCWGCPDPFRRKHKTVITGLDPNTDYTVTAEIAGDGLDHVEAFIDYTDTAGCESRIPVRVVQIDGTFVLDNSDPYHIDSDGRRCDGRDWMDLTCWRRPIIDCAVEACLTVSYSWCQTEVDGLPPEPTFCVQPVTTV